MFGHERGIEILRDTAKAFIFKTAALPTRTGRTLTEEHVAGGEKRNGRSLEGERPFHTVPGHK